jgi:hypothetical protein
VPGCSLFASNASQFQNLAPTSTCASVCCISFIKENEFKELYEYSTQEPFNALVIDATRGKPIFKKNFDKVLHIS